MCLLCLEESSALSPNDAFLNCFEELDSIDPQGLLPAYVMLRLYVYQTELTI